MKFVKLTAKPDTWFDEGTEVYSYDCNPPEQLRRITLEEWVNALNSDVEGYTGILARGLCEGRWDGEWCMVDEFLEEIVDEPF